MILAVVFTSPADAQVSLSLSSGAAAPGGTVTLDVSLNAAGNQPSAIQWTVTYPTSDIASVSAEPGAAAAAAGKSIACRNGSGFLTCVVAGENGTAILNGTLASLSFRLASGTTASTIPIEFTKVYSSSSAGSAISCGGNGSVITALQPATLSSLTCTPGSLTPPGSISCSVGLSGPAPASGAAVTVSDNSSSLSVPGTVTVPAGGTSATFTAAASAVTANTEARITASYGGVSRTASVNLLAPTGTIVALAGLACNPTSLTPPGSVACTVSLTGPAPSGTSVSLSDNSPSVSVPASVTVAPGATSAAFTATASAVTSNSTAVITATALGGSKTASIQLLAPAAAPSLSALACNPASLVSGGSTTCTVSLSAKAISSMSVALASNNAVLPVPGSITIPAGAQTATFSGKAGQTSDRKTVTVSATAAGVTKTAMVTVSPSSGPQPPTEMVAFWPFEEGSGTNTADTSGNGRTAILQGAQWTTDGKSGSALSFNGRNSYVNAGNFDVPGNAMSISAWFKAHSFPANSDARIISKASGSGEQDHIFMLSLYTGQRQTLRLRLKTNGSTKTLIAPGGPITPGVWVHAVATYDGSTARLYKDGVLVAAMPLSGAIATDGRLRVWIGLNPDGSNPFDGLIDQVRVYNRALSPAEIQALMQNDSAPTFPVAVTVSPATASLTASQSRQFAASVTGTADTDVIWSVSPSVGTISSSGLYTAPASIPAPTTVTVKAVSAADSSKFGAATVTLNQTVAVTLTPPAVTLPASAKHQFTASVSGTTNTAVTWSVSPAVGTISSSGLYTAPASISAPTTVTVKAVSAADSSKFATAIVTLNPAVGITLTPSAVTLSASAQQQFTASVSGTANKAVTWSVSPAVGTISSSGLYTAPASITSSQTVTVKAVCAADSTKSATAVVTLAASAPVGTDGLIRYWTFSEGRGTVAADSSAFRRTATLRGAGWTSQGRSGSAVRLDGQDDYVDVGVLDVPGSAITISAWFKADSLKAGQDARILSKATGVAEQDHHIMLSLYAWASSQTLRLRLKTNGTTRTLIAPGGAVTAGAWVHAVATYNGARARLYKNGVEVASMPLSGTIEFNNRVPTFIGANPQGPGNNFHGTIDEVRVYNRALSQQEILGLYQAGQ